MHTLLLRLSGPMQSWGTQSRFGIRDTGREPSKSGVLGLVCAALGRNRQAEIADLAALRMGVRVDQEGSLQTDYQTAQNVLIAKGGIKNTEISHRYYLAGARFLVGLCGSDLGLLTGIHRALRQPVWSLYLGRRAFVPGEPVWLEDGLRKDQDLEPALRVFPWLVPDTAGATHQPGSLRLVVEDEQGSVTRPDQPLSFSTRRFMPRQVRIEFIPMPEVT